MVALPKSLPNPTPRHLSRPPTPPLLPPDERNLLILTTQTTSQLGTPLFQVVEHYLVRRLKAPLVPRNRQATPRFPPPTPAPPPVVLTPFSKLVQSVQQTAAHPPLLTLPSQTTPQAALSAQIPQATLSALIFYHLHLKHLTSWAHLLPPNPSEHSSPPPPLRLHPLPD